MRNASSAVDVKPHHPKLQHVLGWYSICFGLLVHEIGMIMIMFPHCFQWFIISPQRNGHLGSYLHVQTDHDRPSIFYHFLRFKSQCETWIQDLELIDGRKFVVRFFFWASRSVIFLSRTQVSVLRWMIYWTWLEDYGSKLEYIQTPVSHEENNRMCTILDMANDF